MTILGKFLNVSTFVGNIGLYIFVMGSVWQFQKLGQSASFGDPMPKAGRSLFNWFQQSSNPIFQIPIVILSKKSITNLQLPPALSIMIMAVNETLKKTTFSPSFCMTVFQAQHSTTTNFTVPFFINASKQVFGCVIIKRNHLPPHPTPRLFCCEDDFILFRRVTEVTILFKFGVSSFLAQCTCWL